MEFNEKLQQLRKQKGLTQEEAAQALYVSRAAVSKWESGRGFPNLDSLKAIARFYGVTVDQLLSSEDLLTIAEAEKNRLSTRFRELLFSCLDLAAVCFLFLPFFGEKRGEMYLSVSLLSLNTVNPVVKGIYFSFVAVTALFGLLALLPQDSPRAKMKPLLSLFLSAAGVFLFMLSSQPYAGAFLFLLLLIKGVFLLKKP
jgi:transcriptional regulator with XRE-family HTH domain